MTRSDSELPTNFTTAQLRAIYECTAAGTISNPPSILPLLPQAGSGIRASFLQTIANLGDPPVTPGPCVSDRDPTNPSVGLIDNTGNRLTDPRQIAPYSVAQFQAQYYGLVAPEQGNTELRQIDNPGTPPFPASL
ncbi:MAG: hypothetical protein M3Y73_10585 [Actinomycetota bacterium]|nr:hypothetical protein [Actinomycetota bacterium]